jgi:hypothetical protein
LPATRAVLRAEIEPIGNPWDRNVPVILRLPRVGDPHAVAPVEHRIAVVREVVAAFRGAAQPDAAVRRLARTRFDPVEGVRFNSDETGPSFALEPARRFFVSGVGARRYRRRDEALRGGEDSASKNHAAATLKRAESSKAREVIIEPSSKARNASASALGLAAAGCSPRMRSASHASLTA